MARTKPVGASTASTQDFRFDFVLVDAEEARRARIRRRVRQWPMASVMDNHHRRRLSRSGLVVTTGSSRTQLPDSPQYQRLSQVSH